jgi:hypothetical protein
VADFTFRAFGTDGATLSVRGDTLSGLLNADRFRQCQEPRTYGIVGPPGSIYCCIKRLCWCFKLFPVAINFICL